MPIIFSSSLMLLLLLWSMFAFHNDTTTIEMRGSNMVSQKETASQGGGATRCLTTIHSNRMRQGTITSPGYPTNYRPGIKCTYHLLGQAMERVHLIFKEIDLRDHEYNIVDRLMVVTSVARNAMKSIETNLMSTTMSSSRNYYTSPAHFSGNLISFKQKNHSGSRSISTSAGPVLEHAQSGPGMVPTGSWNKDKSLTHLLIDQDKYSVIAIYSGRTEPPILMSAGNHVIVTMVTMTPQTETDDAHDLSSASGFRLDFSFVTNYGIKVGRQDPSGECLFRFSSRIKSQGTFYSPNHPYFYPRSTDCLYLFSRFPGEVLVIKFIFLDVEGIPPSCSNESESDFLEMESRTSGRRIRLCTARPETNIIGSLRTYRFEHHDKRGGKKHGGKNPGEIVEEPRRDGGSKWKASDEMVVRFYSNSVYDARGFLAEYSFEESSSFSDITPPAFLWLLSRVLPILIISSVLRPS